MTTIAVAGATGALGSQICERLRAAGADVRELRRPHVDLTSPETLAVDGVDCVVSTATSFPREDAIDTVDRDGNIALVEAAEAAGVARFVFVSFKPVPLDFPLQRAKRAVEERLLRAQLDAVVLRPGKFMDIWFSPLCGFDVAGRRTTIFGDGTRPVTWIAASDVADAAARAALGEGAGTIELGGPEALSQREVVQVYEDVLGGAWMLEEMPVAELERQLASENAVESSLAAVMLESHLGSVAPAVGTTTVREFATRLL
jgi:uncharacterized protein YbjT (DUF2867 family)